MSSCERFSPYRDPSGSRLRGARFPARLALLLVLATMALTGPVPAEDRPATDRTLESRLTPIIKAHKGTVAVAVKHLRTGETFRYRADEVMPTASLIKFPVMVEAYRQAEAGQVDLDARATLHDRDKVPGSGILTSHFSDGSTFRLRDAVRLMIAFSDNTATNLVLDAIGLGATAATMEQMGYPNTKIHSKVFRRDTSVFPERSKRYGLGSTTADEMIRLCEQLHDRNLVSRKASEAMLEHLRACDDDEKFPRFLPAGTKIAFKTGSLADTRTAAGIIECPAGPVAVCVLSHSNEDHRWVPDNAGNVLCAEIARAVFDHYNKPAEPSPSRAAGRADPARASRPAGGTADTKTTPRS
ncbi:MAG: serine hydrolase [Isosphaeraceae bacterium]